MKRFLATLVVTVGFAAWGIVPAAAQNSMDAAFSEVFFSSVELSESVAERPDVSALDKADMDSLLAAKYLLSDFLRGLARGDATRHLAPALAAQFPDTTALRRQRFGAESYLTFEIIDFRIAEDRQRIKLRYFLSERDRGKASIRQRAVTIDAIGNAWMISEFDNFDFD